ncbi:hypothetical protein [Brassicibacter mesophilus]|uniref:hypothetical protein n=1 Tax=Brassicibacter mesophilus TaxID=745119 RepID=UPI003D262653
MSRKIDLSFEYYQGSVDLTSEIEFHKFKKFLNEHSDIIEALDNEDFFIEEDSTLLAGYIQGDTLYIELYNKGINIIRNEPKKEV